MDNPKRQRCVGSVNTRKKYWTGRVEILHVEAHTDTKRDREGKKRKVTQLEKMNQHADTLADYPYEAQVVELETNQLPTRKNCGQIRKNNRVLSGNWRKQILEEIRIETS